MAAHRAAEYDEVIYALIERRIFSGIQLFQSLLSVESEAIPISLEKGKAFT
jgi:hypothetical protein